jgi:transcription initiation factor TFIIB
MVRRRAEPIPNIIPDKSLLTTAGNPSERLRAGPSFNRMNRLNKWSKRYDSKVTNIVSEAFLEISSLCSKKNIPSHIEEEACVILKKAHNQKLTIGKSIQKTILACIYYACRLHRFPMPLGEIIERSNYNKKEIASTYRTLTRELDYSSPNSSSLKKYLVHFCRQLGIPQFIERTCLDTLEIPNLSRDLGGRSPLSIAGALMLIFSELHGIGITQKKIAEVCQVTDVTLRNNVKAIDKLVMLEVLL